MKQCPIVNWNIRIALTIILLGATLAAEGIAETRSQPNAVVVMADDIGLGDLSYYHRLHSDQPPSVITPNLDRLIESGMRFSDAHSPSSLCAPTRFSMMTGNFTYRNSAAAGSFSPVKDSLIEPYFTTIARIAKAGGYHTAFFGKWGLGSVWNSRDADFSKIEQGAVYFGFDYAFELPQGIQNWPHAFYENQQWMPITPDSKLTGLSKEQAQHHKSGIGDSNWDPALAGPMLAKKAVAYIEKQTTAYPDEPFYLYYCSQAVHIPHTPTAELDGVKVAGGTPGTHGDMILELDTQVGMLQKALKKAGVYEDTLFVFTSDNGGLNSDAAMREAGHKSSFVLTGKKGSYFEGGHRVPFIAVWPGKIEANTESHETIVTHDMVATVSALAGQPLHPTVLDSANLLPYFTGTATKKAHKYLLHRGGKGPTYALREGDWKLILETDPNWKTDKDENVDFGPLTAVGLYNLKEHLSEDETFNLIENPEHAKRVESMHASYLRLRKTQEPTVVN